MLKIPVNGHHDAWDTLASDSLRSEALTVRMIGRHPDIPVPAIHHFNDSLDNEIGCPYILMDHMKGKPLHEVWWDDDNTCSRTHLVKLRCLRTIATAMVALSEFRFDRGGSVRFDSDGNPTGIGDAKACDNYGDVDNGSDDDLYCTKGPLEDPLSALLYMLDRRGVKIEDSALHRGMHECLRMFTNWTLEDTKAKEEKFVLAHPDLDSQNILVEDDGTLCGIIDWDGVAAVPHSVGPFKYPIWLVRDWIGSAGREVEESEQLDLLRMIYSQYIEAAMLASTRDISISNKAGSVTRSSLVLGSLELAADDPDMTQKLIVKIYQQMADVMAELEYDDTPETNSTASSDSEDEDYEDLDSESWDGVIDRDFWPADDIEESVADGVSNTNMKAHCPRCIVDSAKAYMENRLPRSGISKPEDEGTPNKPPQDISPMVLRPPGEGAINSTIPHPCVISSEVEPNTMLVSSRKARLGKFFCDMAEKGCRGLAKKLHRKGTPGEPTESFPPLKPSHEDTSVSAKEPQRLNMNVLDSKIQEVANHTKDPVHPDIKGIAKNNRLKAFIMWLVAMIHKLINNFHGEKEKEGKAAKDREAHVSICPEETKAKAFKGVGREVPHHPMTAIPERGSEAQVNVVLQPELSKVSDAKSAQISSRALEHAEDCPKAAKNIAKREADLRFQEAGLTFQEVWARIGREVQSAGISTTMLKEDQEKIADDIITIEREKRKRKEEEDEEEKMKKEAEAEKERKRRKVRKAEKKAAKAAAAINASVPGAMEMDNANTENIIRKKEKGIGEAEDSSATLSPAEPSAANTETEQADLTGDPVENGAVIQAAVQQPMTKTKSVGKPVIFEPQLESNAMDPQPLVMRKTAQDQSVEEEIAASGEAEAEATKACARKRPTVPEIVGVPIPATSPPAANDGKPIPRCKPCPCGSGHKYKKCCGKAYIPQYLETVVETVVEPEVSASIHADSFRSSNEDSQSADLQLAPARTVSLQTPVIHISDGDDKMASGIAGKAGKCPRRAKEAHKDSIVDLDGLTEEKVDSGCHVLTEISTFRAAEAKPKEPYRVRSRDGSKVNWMPAEEDSTWSEDKGGMSVKEILVALGKGELDVKRFERLRKRFIIMLDVLLGRI